MGLSTDDVLEKCGALGKYQLVQTFFLFIINFCGGQQFLIVVFHMYEPKHRCAIPSWENDTYSLQGFLHNESIYSLIDVEQDGCKLNSTACSKYVYDKAEYFGETVVEEFDLVCERNVLSTLSTTLFTVGLMVGAFACGIISDRIGRKWTLFGSLMIASAFSCATIFSQNMIMYITFRLIVGACYTGAALVVSVLSLEITGPSRRSLVMLIKGFFWPLGVASLSLICYFLPDWQNNQIVLTVFTFLSGISVIVFVKESPHYLIVKGRNKEACDIFHYMAKMNGKAINDDIIEELKEEEEGAQQEKLISLFKSKTLLKKTAIFFYMWFIAGLGYYGLSFNVKNLSGNLFLNHVISSSVELIVPFSVMASQWTGRKIMTVSHLFLGGAALMTSAMASAFLTDMGDLPIDVDALKIGVFMVGKYGISVVFSFAYFWCTEVYPTTVRSSLGGISSVFARLGSILSPILVDLYKFVDTPLKLGFGPLIFSLTMIIGGFLTLLLPETANTKVPETIAEANAFHPGKPNKRSDSFSKDGKLNHAFESETKL